MTAVEFVQKLLNILEVTINYNNRIAHRQSNG